MHERALALLELVVLGPLEHRGEMVESGSRRDRASTLARPRQKTCPGDPVDRHLDERQQDQQTCEPGNRHRHEQPIPDTVPIAGAAADVTVPELR